MITLNSRVAIQLLYIDDNGDFDRVRSAWAGNVSHLITFVLSILWLMSNLGQMMEKVNSLTVALVATNQTIVERVFIGLFRMVWYGAI